MVIKYAFCDFISSFALCKIIIYHIAQFFDGENFSLSIISSSITNTGGLGCCPSLFSPSNFSMKNCTIRFKLHVYCAAYFSVEIKEHLKDGKCS